jgi:hypothetical protein
MQVPTPKLFVFPTPPPLEFPTPPLFELPSARPAPVYSKVERSIDGFVCRYVLPQYIGTSGYARSASTGADPRGSTGPARPATRASEAGVTKHVTNAPAGSRASLGNRVIGARFTPYRTLGKCCSRTFLRRLWWLALRTSLASAASLWNWPVARPSRKQAVRSIEDGALSDGEADQVDVRRSEGDAREEVTTPTLVGGFTSLSLIPRLSTRAVRRMADAVAVDCVPRAFIDALFTKTRSPALRWRFVATVVEVMPTDHHSGDTATAPARELFVAALRAAGCLCHRHGATWPHGGNGAPGHGSADHGDQPSAW